MAVKIGKNVQNDPNYRVIADDKPYLSIPRISEDFDFNDLKTHVVAISKNFNYSIHGPWNSHSDIGGAGGGIEQLYSWILQLAPDQIYELVAWFLGTYASKEFIKGFAADAGKDAWLGIKNLIARSSLIKGQHENIKFAQKLVPLAFKLQMKSKNERTSLSVYVEPALDNHDKRMEYLESQVLPAASIFLNAARNNDFEAGIIIKPDFLRFEYSWLVIQGFIISLNCKEKTYTHESDIQLNNLHLNIFRCLDKLDYKNLGADTETAKRYWHGSLYNYL